MRLKANLTLLIVILGANLSFCQYPIVKKIKDDTVVILTLNQSEQINKLFINYSDTIGKLKLSLFNTILTEKDSVYNWKWKYKANKEVYYKRENDYETTKKYDQYVKYVLLFIIIFQFSKLD